MDSLLKRRTGLSLLCLTFCFIEIECLHGEDVTTLDGRAFTNVTVVNTNYRPLIVLTHADGKTGVNVTNLPTDFRARYGLTIRSNKPAIAATQPQIDTVTAFLRGSQHSDIGVGKVVLKKSYFRDPLVSDEVIKLVGDKEAEWYLGVRQDGFCLSAERTSRLNGQSKLEETRRADFDFGEDQRLAFIFDKFLEWDSIAASNKVEEFERVITKYPYPKSLSASALYNERKFLFCWSNFSLTDEHSSLTARDGTFSGGAKKADVLVFRELLKLLPGLKKELADKIKNQARQSDLFK